MAWTHSPHSHTHTQHNFISTVASYCRNTHGSNQTYCTTDAHANNKSQKQLCKVGWMKWHHWRASISLYILKQKNNIYTRNICLHHSSTPIQCSSTALRWSKRKRYKVLQNPKLDKYDSTAELKAAKDTVGPLRGCMSQFIENTFRSHTLNFMSLGEGLGSTKLKIGTPMTLNTAKLLVAIDTGMTECV